MEKASNPTAGLHDPYWYESSVGLGYIVDMINPDNEITTVTLQAVGLKGLDDIVVAYKHGAQKLIQVKHTRVAATLTFGDLLAIDEDTKAREDDKTKDMSLITQLAYAWKEAKVSCSGDVTAILYTNRSPGKRPYTPKDKEQPKRPPLDQFWPDLKRKIGAATKLEDITFDAEYDGAWKELLSHLKILGESTAIFQFLSKFDIDYSQPSLDELEQELIKKISVALGITAAQSRSVLADLDTALRKWATTARGKKQTVTIEDIYEALSFSRNESVGEHHLAPPEPFFPSRKKLVEDLESNLKNRICPIIFLTGKPGYGKTSVISALTNRHEPVIDLRFHAYKPIMPNSPILPSDAGRTTKSEVLWGDLLIQLRSLLKGRLAKYRVPLQNDFLSADGLRTHVLRIASELATDQGRSIVIAIDGIDHAARASLNQNLTFLSTLVAPEHVPNGVCFLIAGQPAYNNYPIWLKQSHAQVRVFEVPPIEETDITPLVNRHGKLLPTDQHDAAKRLICSVAGGSTLSAVFAAYELETYSDISQFQRQLEERNLKDGVSAYYESIWSSAVDDIERKVPFVTYSLAGCISLINERLSGEILSKIFGNLGLVSSIWTEILRKLRPLLIEEAGGFRILHNDVRVFLQQKMQAESERLSDIAGQMADYYLTEPTALSHRHYSLFRLLDLAKRTNDKAKVFDSAFVLEAHLSGQSLAELIEQALEALNAAVRLRSWEYLRQIKCSLATLRQLDNSVTWVGRPGSTSVIRTEQLPPVLIAEGRVPQREVWNVEILKNALEDASRLIAAGELDRARGLLNRWFQNLSPNDVAGLLKKDEIYAPSEQKNNLGRVLTEPFQNLLAIWGEVYLQAGILSKISLSKGSTIRERSINATFIGAALKSAVQSPGQMRWLRTLRKSLDTDIYARHLENLVSELAQQRRWMEVAYSLRQYGDRPQRFSATFRAWAGAWSILLGLSDLHATWTAPLLEGGFQLLHESRDQAEYLLSTAMHLCFVLGASLPSRTPSGIRQDAIDEYYKIMQGERDRPYCAVLCYASALAGKWLKACLDKSLLRAQTIATLDEIRGVFHALLTSDQSLTRMLTQSVDRAKNDLLETLIYCVDYAGEAPKEEAREIIESSAKKHFINNESPVVWNYLASCGYSALLNEWLDAWIDNDIGLIWQQDIAGRFTAIEDLRPLAVLCNREADLTIAHQRLLWGAIGYTGHKEYSLSSPLQWFKALATVAPASWKEEGLRLLALSAEASRARDNRLDSSVEAAVATAACRCSAPDLWALLHAQNGQGRRIWLTPGYRSLLEGIADFIASAHLSEEYLLVFWSLAIGCLWWPEYYDREHIVEFRKAIIDRATQEGYGTLLEKLLAKSSIEATLTSREKSTEESAAAGPIFTYEARVPIDESIRAVRAWIESNSGHVHGAVWMAVAEIAKRVKVEHPNNFDEHVNSLTRLLELREPSYRSYRWSFDGIGVAFEEIIPLLGQSDLWEVTERIIQSGDKTKHGIWLEYLDDSLDTLCLCRAKEEGEQSLRSGLRETLHTHETWVTGNGKLPAIKAIFLVEPGQPLEPPTWSTLTFRLLSQLLDSDSSQGIEAALRGLWFLLDVDNSTIDLLSNHLPAASHRAKPYLLLLIERLTVSNYTKFLLLKTAVAQCLEIRDVQIALQCWVIFEAYRRQSGATIPDILRTGGAASAHAEKQVEIITAPRAPQTPPINLGSLRLNSGILGYLERLKIITGEDLHDIEATVMERLSNIEYSHYKPDISPDEHRSGNMGIVRPVELRLLDEVLYEQLSAGRWSDIPLAQFAQILLPNEDPFVALHSPTPSRESAFWPPDHKSLTKEELLINFNKLAVSDLVDDSVVIGALITAHNDRVDLNFSYAYIASNQQLPNTRLGGSTTPSGRSFVFYHDDLYLSAQPFGMWLTWNAGGIATLIAQDLGIIPSIVWQAMFGWNPSPNNPLLWLKDGEPVAWYERIVGPLRGSAGELYFRQPMMRRWVCTKAAWAEVNECLVISPPQLRIELDTFEIRSPN